MSTKRTNFKAMNQQEFIAHLNSKNITFELLNTTSSIGVGVIKITPQHFRLQPRIFNSKTKKQLDSNIDLTGIDTNMNKNDGISKKQLLKIIDDRIQNMGTKGVYHPKRLKPKWNSLTNDDDKLKLFEKYISTKESSIGFLKLVRVNLCHKTLEAIVFEHPTIVAFLSNKNVKQVCIEKFNKYPNGIEYLKGNKASNI